MNRQDTKIIVIVLVQSSCSISMSVSEHPFKCYILAGVLTNKLVRLQEYSI